MLVDLIAAYDTVWHRGLTCKLFRLVSENWEYLSHRCIVQKTEIACRTFSGYLQGQNEALTQKHCEQPFPWCTPRMSAALQSGVAKFTLASLTVFLMTPCTLSLNVCFPFQWTIRQFWQISNQLSFVDKKQLSAKYSEGKSELRVFVPRPSVRPLRMGRPRLVWIRLNRFRTCVERFQSSMHK